MSNIALATGITAGVAMQVLAETPVPVPTDITPWLSGGGLGILGFIVIITLWKTIPGLVEAHCKSNELFCKTITEIRTQIHADQLAAFEFFRDVIANQRTDTKG